VQRIVKQCDGSIELTSRAGDRDRVSHPTSRVLPIRRGASRVECTGHAPQGAETVLLAEDDPAVRLLARMSLGGALHRARSR